MISRLRLALVLGSVTALGPLSIDMYLPSLPTLEAELAASPASVQHTLAAYFFGMALGQLFYGPLSDRLGRKLPLAAGLGIFLLASVGCALAWSVQSLIALRFVQALGGCAGMVIARATIRDLYVGADAARMFSAMVLVMGLAPILAPLAGGYVLVHGGWRTIFWVLAAFGTVALVATLAALPETLERSTRRMGSLGDALARIRSVARDARFLVPGMLLALPFAAVFAYISSAPFVLIQYFGVRVEAFGWFFGANALGLIAGSQMNSRLLRRARSAVILRRAIRLQTVMALVLLATATTGAGGLPGVVLPLFFVVASIGFIAPNASAIAMTPFGADAGTASALLGTCQALAGVVATVAVGFMPGSGAVPMAAVIAACTVLACVIDTFGRRRRSV